MVPHRFDESIDRIQNGFGELFVIVYWWCKLVGERTLGIPKDVVLHRVFCCDKVESNLLSTSQKWIFILVARRVKEIVVIS